MKRYLYLLTIILAGLSLIVAACTPTSGKPESIAAETAVEDTSATKGEDMTNGLTGVRWVLGSYINAAGEMVNVLAGNDVTAEFGADGRVAGNAGCNQYFAGYTVDGNTLTISEAGSTLMACDPPEIMQQESEFQVALQSVAAFTIDDGQLLLANADGTTVLIFQAGASAGLTGTNWTATMYNTGTQAVTNLTEGTTITANFSEDGSLNGLASCNNYMTSYTLDGQNITIQPPATTRKLCPEPEGVMEQEMAFVSMLPQAATYHISGDTLELRTADGALIASFVAAP